MSVLSKADINDEDSEKIMHIVAALHRAAQDFVVSEGHHSHDFSLIMTAAAIFAGTVYGALVATGAAEDSLKNERLTAEVTGRNFRVGIPIGKETGRRAMAAIAPNSLN